MEKIYSIHEYTFIKSEKKLKHAHHETDFASNTVRRLIKNEPDYTKVILVLNGCENDEQAYILENKKMITVGSRDAFTAVEIIASLPFYQCTNWSLIDHLSENMFRQFLDRPDENERPF